MGFLIAAFLVASVFAEPESEAKADAKPWLAYSNLGYAGYPYAAGYSTYGAYPYATYGLGYTGYTGYGAHFVGKRSAEAESDAKPWLTLLTTDMLDTHTLPPMVLMLTHPLSTPMPLMPPQSPPMLELTSSAREKPKLNLMPSHG